MICLKTNLMNVGMVFKKYTRQVKLYIFAAQQPVSSTPPSISYHVLLNVHIGVGKSYTILVRTHF